MKQSRLSYYFLLSILFQLQVSISALDLYNWESEENITVYKFNTEYTESEGETFVYIATSEPFSPDCFMNFEEDSKEGFCKNTLIETSNGFKYIQELSIDDYVFDVDGNKKQVINIIRKFVPEHVKILVDYIEIYAGAEQLFCVNNNNNNNNWVKAKDLKTGDILTTNFNNNSDNINTTVISEIEIISEEKLVYAITVKDHLFCISSDSIFVHNYTALLIGSACTVLQKIVLKDPVKTILTIKQLYSIYSQNINKETSRSLFKNQDISNNILKIKTSFNDQQKTVLLDIKCEFETAKNCLKKDAHQALQEKTVLNCETTSFTNIFLDNKVRLDNQSPIFNIVTTGKLNLSEPEKSALAKQRELEIQLLIKDIFDLQLELASHASEIIKQVDNALKAHHQITTNFNPTQQTKADWKRFITVSEAKAFYEKSIIEESSLKTVELKLIELKKLEKFYKDSPESACLRTTTNISDEFKKLKSTISRCEKSIYKEKSRINENIAAARKYFIRRNICLKKLDTKIKLNLENKNKIRAEQELISANRRLTELKDSDPINSKTPEKNTKDPKNIAAVKKTTTGSIKTLDDILKDLAPPIKKKSVKKETVIFEKPGTFEDAVKDFEDMGVMKIQPISTGKRGILPDGRDINVRSKSSDDRPTIEIQEINIKQKIKIRYGNKEDYIK